MSDVKVVDLDKPVLRHRQVKELQAELENLERQERDPERARSFRSASSGYDPGLGRRSLRQAKQMLAQAPKQSLEPEERDYLATQAKTLEEKIRHGMPTQYEMRANPPGSVAKHMKWEKSNKKDIMRWKNAKVRLEPDNEDQDLANVETLRPSGHRWVPAEAYRSSYDKVEWGETAAASPEGFGVNVPVREESGKASKYVCECGRGFDHHLGYHAHRGRCPQAPAEARRKNMKEQIAEVAAEQPQEG